MTRTLLYVPVIHDEADLGRAGAKFSRKTAGLAGDQRWARHHEVTTRRFWKGIAAFLHAVDPSRLRIYQDGMAAGGETARAIVEEAARRGSRNYQLVQELLGAGAKLRQTEDPQLLLQEYREQLARLEQEPDDASLSRAGDDRLLDTRDRFIAATVNATLQDGEIGVLFVGAQHEVPAFLDQDIAVVLVKDPRRVRAYFAALLLGAPELELMSLARYLAAPVDAILS